jgi:hypothetical protein
MRSRSGPASIPPRGRSGPSRRTVVVAARTWAAVPAAAGTDSLRFDDLYEGSGVLGLRFAPPLLAARGRSVQMRGYMAPPLKAESQFFVLTREPVSICPFCSSDADWPTDIVVVYLRDPARPIRFSDEIAVTGTMEVGSWTDPDTGFVSQIRLVDAAFRIV